MYRVICPSPYMKSPNIKSEKYFDDTTVNFNILPHRPSRAAKATLTRNVLHLSPGQIFFMVIREMNLDQMLADFANQYADFYQPNKKKFKKWNRVTR